MERPRVSDSEVRLIWRMHHENGMRQQEIAEAVGRSCSTVYYVIHGMVRFAEAIGMEINEITRRLDEQEVA